MQIIYYLLKLETEFTNNVINIYRRIRNILTFIYSLGFIKSEYYILILYIYIYILYIYIYIYIVYYSIYK